MARLLLLALGLLAAGCRASSVEAPLVYDGSTTISGRVLDEAAPALAQKAHVRFAEVRKSGAGKGLKAALAGKVSVAGVTRSLTEAELAQRPYFQIIGYDALGVFVNEANPVRALTKAQLKAVYTGEIRNWKAVGGADVPIAVCTEHLSSGRATLDAVKTMALDDRPYGPVRELEDPADCLKLVAAEPGTVTVATIAYQIAGTRALALDGIHATPDSVRSGAYLLSRPMLLVSRSVPSGSLKAFFDFMLSPDGQAIVGKRFVALR